VTNWRSWPGLEDDCGGFCVHHVTQSSAGTRTCDPQLVGLGCCRGSKRGERDQQECSPSSSFMRTIPSLCEVLFEEDQGMGQC